MDMNQTPLAATQRHAFNAAFYELGLRFHWDDSCYDCAMCDEEQRSHLKRYLENEQAHLLKAYDADFLVDAIQTVKQRWLENASQDTAPASVNWAAFQQAQVGF